MHVDKGWIGIHQGKPQVSSPVEKLPVYGGWRLRQVAAHGHHCMSVCTHDV